MSERTAYRCIYCGEAVQTSGEGDHVIPAAFGEFMDDIRFMRICSGCNNEIGRHEEELIRCGPESVIKAFAPMKSRRTRGRGIGGSVGARGTPPPESRVDHGDHTSLVERDRTNPQDVFPIDQFVVRCPDGECRSVRLFQGMQPADLRDRVRKLGVEEITEAWWHGGDDEWVQKLVQEAYPNLKHEERDATPAGIHQADGVIRVVVSKSYFRAVAKIALHYYLTRNQRGLHGHEQCFDAVRRFIRYGEGDRRDFFDKPGPRLVSPVGMKVAGGQLRPTEWGHLLVAMDAAGALHVQVTLFAGPEVVLEPHRLVLAQLGPIYSPRPGLAHVYKYEEVSGHSRYAGRVYEESLRRISV